MTRSLLLKGLAGVAALGGTVGGLAFYRKEIFGGWGKGQEEPKSEDVSKLTDKELIDKVGLDCKLGESETELTGSDSKDCTVKNNETIKVKIGDKEEEGVTFTGNGSKLKVSKSEEKGGDGGDKYTKKLKFVVDSGDISLNKTGGTSSIQKLEQFETYEVFLRDKKFYLRRKTDAKEEKIKALGLPTGKGKCYLPDTGSSECSLSKEDIKTVSFEKQASEQITVSTGEVRLKISKMSDSTDFTDGYRFTFTFPSDQTINSKQLKANTPYDFKIKKPNSGNAITLEKAWSDDNAFTKKAGLECTNQSECNVSSTNPKLNVKVGDKTKEGISSISTGKIKMETEQEGYNQGLKFIITTADISLSSGTGEIQKLEELETYEITEEGGKYYLTRKTSKEESIRSSLSIPESCFTTLGTSCTLSADAFKAINFEGKSSPTSSGNITLKISKTSSADFPLGYRFTFNTTTEATIKTDTKIKANIPTDFKIKKNDSNPASISLEKAWSDTNYSFAAKVGLDCSSSDGCCTKSSSPSPDINVKRGTETKTGITSFGTSSGKIKVEKDQAGYNQGLKFTITGGSVSLTGGSGGSFTQLDEYETYEITEEGDKYYLTRKTEASENIVSLLGLPSSCKLSSNSCSLSTEDIKKVKFDGRDETNGASMSLGTATLTITSGANTTDFPLGYKFTLKSTSGVITIKNNTNKVADNIPTEFKIKKDTTTPTTLSLEKAWTAESLGKKVGLDCKESSGTECCNKSNGSEKLNVKQGSDKKEDINSIGTSSSAKIKVEKDQVGYNQGLKFTIDGGDLSLTGGNKVGSSSDISKLEEFETYEIKEEGGKWYLSRKSEAIVFLKKALGFEFCPKENFGQIFTCDITDVNKLKGIKFHNIGSFSSWPPAPIKIQLSIERETNQSGLKFTFNDDSTNSDDEKVKNSTGSWCIPDGAGGSFDLKNVSTNAEYKIKKSGSGSSLSLCLEKKDGNSAGTCAK